jgi:hypothetical protein
MLIRSSGPIAAVVFCGLLVTAAYAQDPGVQTSAPAPPNLAYIEGAVDVVQDGVSERADPPVMLLAGDVVRTRNGRAEIVFGDGSMLHLGEDSELEILDTAHLRLVSGRAIVRVSHAAASPYAIDTPSSTIRLEAQGEYTVMTDRSARLEVAVTRGAATVHETTAWTLRGGQSLVMTGLGARPLIQTFNSARFDALTQWAYDRVNGYAQSASAPQLPYELRPYGPVFDQYGSWDYVAPYGQVWYPTVGVGWRPYYDGAWGFTRYGWTWHGRDRWAWPTHHYGRWGFNLGRWYWIPAASWSPAWVSWSVAGGFVSWSPLGWDGHPSIGFWGRRDHPAYWPDYSPWRGWTVVRRDHFAPRRNVRAHAVDGTRLDEPTRLALANAIPRSRTADVAVPRSAVAAPGTRGNVRRPQPPPPQTLAPSAPESVTPGARLRRADDPAYIPPRTWNSGDVRRGSARDPWAPEGPSRRNPWAAAEVESSRPRPTSGPPGEGSDRDLTPGSGRARIPGPSVSSPNDGGNEPRTPEPRAIPRSEPRPSNSGERGGAGARDPRGAVPQPPPASPPPDRSGGAVERSGSSRRPPSAGRDSSGDSRPPAASPGAPGGARRRPPR